MGRECSDCGYYLSCCKFSSNQWRKGEGWSRCKECVNGGYTPSTTLYECHACNRTFENQNNLEMHMQVHRPRNISCPICHETRFRSGANAVQHVESGYCSGCRGAKNARNQIYQFASQQRSMNRYLTDVPLLGHGGGYGGGSVPDYPYHCPDCSKSFRQLSQLLQHQDQKHNSARMISY